MEIDKGAFLSKPTEDSPLHNHKNIHRQHRLRLRYYSRKQIRLSRDRDHRSFRRFWIYLISTVLATIILILSIGGAGAYATYSFYTSRQAHYLTQVTTLRDLLPLDNLKIYDSKNILIAQSTDAGLHTYVPFKAIAPPLVNITVAVEDKDFWTNSGVDITRIIQSAIEDLRQGQAVEGGSTITQQLIKTLIVGNQENTTHQFDNANLLRKLDEIVLTPEINNHYSKAEVMEMYLNSIYYGEQCYGIDAAASFYFGLEDKPGKSAASQLDMAQSAMLVGIPNSPTLFDPLLNPTTGFQRFETVLNLAIRNHAITYQQAQDAIQEAQSPHFFKRPASLTNRAPHFVAYIMRQLEQKYHQTEQQLARSGMSVYTTLNITLQDKIQKIMQSHIAAIRDAHHVTNAAEVLIDFHTGAIISLLGSIDYYNNTIDGQFDVATQGFRQPGSSFKPYVYATALEQGASPAQAIDDTAISIKMPPGSSDPYFSPSNYDMQYHGHMTMRCALQNSLNIPAVKTLQHVGINNAMATAKKMGIEHTQGFVSYSMVLGGLDVNLLEHTSAFGTFADAGVHVPYYSIQKIVFVNGNQNQDQTHKANHGTRAISPQIAFMMTDMLSDNTSRYMEFNSCSALLLYSTSEDQCYAGNPGQVRPAAAKTGTTNDFADNWTMGYTTDYVMGVWAGNNDHSHMIDVTGVVGAAPIWHDSMLVAEKGHPIKNFTYPGGLEKRFVTYPDGVTTTDWFAPGTYPKFNTRPFNNTPVQPNTMLTTPTTTVAHPYCSTFTYAFNPPYSSGSFSTTRGWW
jgi:membrane peptidoglycan carboxypeptidase